MVPVVVAVAMGAHAHLCDNSMADTVCNGIDAVACPLRRRYFPPSFRKRGDDWRRLRNSTGKNDWWRHVDATLNPIHRLNGVVGLLSWYLNY